MLLEPVSLLRKTVSPLENNINSLRIEQLKDEEIAIGILTTQSRHATHALPAHRGWLSAYPHSFCSDIFDAELQPLVYENIPNEQGKTPGESKWAEGLIWARKSAGPNFKWLLFGDDDVLYIVPRLKVFLQNFDHRKPYIFGHAHPPDVICTDPQERGNGTCCTASSEKCQAIPGVKKPLRDCPIKRNSDPSARIPFKETVESDPDLALMFPSPSSWTYGGAGMILSRGMMDIVSDTYLRFCSDLARCWGYDVRFAACFELLGYNLHHVPQMTGAEDVNISSVLNSDTYTYHKVNGTVANELMKLLTS